MPTYAVPLASVEAEMSRLRDRMPTDHTAEDVTQTLMRLAAIAAPTVTTYTVIDVLERAESAMSDHAADEEWEGDISRRHAYEDAEKTIHEARHAITGTSDTTPVNEPQKESDTGMTAPISETDMREALKDLYESLTEQAEIMQDHGDRYRDDMAHGMASAYHTAARRVHDLGERLLATDDDSHPLDAAITATTHRVSSYASVPLTTEGLYVAIACCASSTYSTHRSADTAYRREQLAHSAYRASQLLRHLGVGDPWQAMRDEYDRAKEKHGDMTLDNPAIPDTIKYYALMEEVGEVARCLTYDREHAGDLAAEVTQVGALALAWLVPILTEGGQ